MSAPTEVVVGTGIGAAVDRKEDKKLLQGQAQWVDNMHAHGMVYLGIVIGTMTGIAFPALQSMMTMRIDEDSQGELQGAIASTIGLTSIIGPVVMTHIFERYANARGAFFPGAPFVAAAVLMLAAIMLLIATMRRYFGPPSPSDVQG